MPLKKIGSPASALFQATPTATSRFSSQPLSGVDKIFCAGGGSFTGLPPARDCL